MRAIVVLVLLAGACKGKPSAVAGKARLTEAKGTLDPPAEGALVEVPGEAPDTLSGKVRIAADRDATFADVKEVADKVRAGGGEPVYLVKDRRENVRALPPSDVLEGDAIVLWATAEVKACVQPPRVDKMACVTSLDGEHVESALVRELVREAVKKYGLEQVEARVDGSLSWGDAVRAIDGARTCCTGTTVRVSW